MCQTAKWTVTIGSSSSLCPVRWSMKKLMKSQKWDIEQKLGFFHFGITFLVFNLFPCVFIYFGADGLEIYFLWSDLVHFCYNGPKSDDYLEGFLKK